MLASSMTLTDLKRVARVRQQQLSFLLYYPTVRLWSIQWVMGHKYQRCKRTNFLHV